MDDHTMKDFRDEFWVPELLDRSNWTVWQPNGAKPLSARLHEKVLYLLEHYQPAPTSAEIDQELARIVARADEMH